MPDERLIMGTPFALTPTFTIVVSGTTKSGRMDIGGNAAFWVLTFLREGQGSSHGMENE